ncbi:MAG: histidine kinase [Candidatus Krumholzibacteriia bacterium]
MARIFLMGDSPLAEQVQAWLLRWGHGVTHAAGEAALQPGGSLRGCDVIVVVCDGHGVEGLCPVALATREEMAPVILVGRAGRSCRQADSPLEHVPDPGRGGRRLRRALGYCLQRTELTRRHLAELTGHHEYVQFLGHELRTPITSALAALEILAGEGTVGPQSGGREADFVRIALRNLKRLRETLEWTEDHLDARTSALAPRWRDGRLGELVTQAVGLEAPRPDLSLVFEAGAESLPVVSDGHLLRGLLQQVCRTLRYHAPGAHVTLRISARVGVDEAAPWRGGAPAEFVVALHVSWPPDSRGPTRVSRTSLVEPGEGPQQELSRLVRLTVSREILALFGARLPQPPHEHGAPALRFVVPGVPAGATAVFSCVPCPAVSA